MFPEDTSGCIGIRNPYFTPSASFLTDRTSWGTIDVNGISKLLKLSAPTWLTDRTTLFPNTVEFIGKSASI